MDWISHSDPRQTWEEHVSGTIRLNRLFREGMATKLFDFKLLHPLSALTAGFHDLVKTTSYFQEYIETDSATKAKLKGTPLYRHTPLSAVCCYYAAFHMYERHGLKESLDPLVAYMVVRRHHGPLISILAECDDEEDQQTLIRQAEALPWDEVKESLLRMLDPDTIEISGIRDLPFSKRQAIQWIEEFPRHMRRHSRYLFKNSDKYGSMELYLKTQTLFSLLIDADKSQVAIRREDVFRTRPKLDSGKIAAFVESLPSGSGIHGLRARAWNEMKSANLSLEQRIYMLNLPTGMGKTLNAFYFAMRLKNKIEEESDGKIVPRIVYALPFLSVIDQNADVYRKVLFGDEKPWSPILLKHHHLAEMKYEMQNDGDEMTFDRNAAQLLIEGWNSEIIITTFVQLFHTLIGNRNASIRKFHRLSHAILLIDEFQSMPVKYWPAVRELFLALSEWLDCRILFLTATDPKIFREDEIHYLCDRTYYYQSVNRLVLYADVESAVTVVEFAKRVQIEPGKRYLFIVNTVPCAVDLFRKLKERFGDRKMTFLSTHVLPHERLERIKRIQNKEFEIVVSTQLVEAGVDIDFDVVYRDWAPLDSIYQSAGRCNRNGDRAGELHVIRLIRENGHAYAPHVYGGTKGEADNRLEITRQLLAENPVMNESQFLQLIEVYFDKVKAGRAFRTSEQLIRAMKELIYTGESAEDWQHAEHFPLEHFKLIEEDQAKTDVFFMQDDRAEALWSQYEHIQNLQDPFERYSKFMEIKSDFYQYVLSLPQSMKNIPPILEGMYVVDRLQMERYYDPVTGYRNEDVTVIY
jgi:CRISPR-associated endonuclease/helicase Cas3